LQNDNTSPFEKEGESNQAGYRVQSIGGFARSRGMTAIKR
jgi:hypothetical protein